VDVGLPSLPRLLIGAGGSGRGPVLDGGDETKRSCLCVRGASRRRAGPPERGRPPSRPPWGKEHDGQPGSTVSSGAPAQRTQPNGRHRRCPMPRPPCLQPRTAPPGPPQSRLRRLRPAQQFRCWSGPQSREPGPTWRPPLRGGGQKDGGSSGASRGYWRDRPTAPWSYSGAPRPPIAAATATAGGTGATQ
jgi:hypothetical protein